MLLSGGSLSLPIWSDMDAGVLSEICSAIKSAHEFADEVKAALQQEGDGVVCASGRY
jgi:hypothetical protein